MRNSNVFIISYVNGIFIAFTQFVLMIAPAVFTKSASDIRHRVVATTKTLVGTKVNTPDPASGQPPDNTNGAGDAKMNEQTERLNLVILILSIALHQLNSFAF